MAESFVLAMPCQMLTLQLMVAAEQGMTNLEDLCARGVLAGRRDVGALAQLFAVPERLIVDVVSSLWAKGYMSFDFSDGALDLTDAAVRELTDARSLAGTGQVQSRKFVYEPISGRILLASEREVRSRCPADSLELPMREIVELENLPQSALVQAVQAAITRERQAGLTGNVLQVSLGHRQFRESAVIQWVVLRASAIVDAESKRLKVSLAEYAWESARAAISDYVADIVDSEPDSKLAAELIRRAQITLDPPERIEVLLRRMAEISASLDEEEKRNQLETRQRLLVSHGERIRSRLTDLQSKRVDASCVQGLEGHQWAVDYLIENSVRQFVLACPQIEYEQFSELLPKLEEALCRRVQLVILWGRAPESKLPSRVLNALSDLQTRYNTTARRLVRVARESCRTDGCLVIQDNRRALIGSHSVAAPVWGGTMPVSVMLEPAADGPAVPEVVEDLLLWARNELPDLQDRQGVLSRRDEFRIGSETVPGTAEVVRMDWPPISRSRDDAAVRLLAGKWQSTQRALQALYADIMGAGPGAEQVSEGGIRQLSLDLMRSAERHLIVADDRTDPSVASSSLATLLRQRRAHGAIVQLVHPALKEQDAQDPFGQLATGPDRVSVRLARGSSRMLVADEEVVVGSYSLLAESGGRFTPRHRRRSKVGVRIRGAHLAAELAAAQGVAVLAPALILAPEPEPLATADALAYSLLTRMRGDANSGEGIRAVVDSMRALNDPWAVLTAWMNAEVPARELRRVAAAMMRSRFQAGNRDDWARWIVLDAWRRRAWVEASMLAPLAGPKDFCLGQAAVLVSALEVGPLGDAASDAAIELAEAATPELQLVGAVAGLADCLIWADPEGVQAIRVLSDALPSAWSALAQTAVQRFDAAEGPLALGLLVNEQTRQEMLAGLDQTRRNLHIEIDELERLKNRFDFPTGVALRRGLFAADGLLTRIRSAAADSVAAFVPLRPTLPSDVQDHLNAVIKAAGEEPMAWAKQMTFLRHIDRIVRRAERTGVQAQTAMSPANTVVLGSGQAHVAREASRLRNQLLLETEQVEGELQPPLRAMLSRLEPLSAWVQAVP